MNVSFVLAAVLAMPQPAPRGETPAEVARQATRAVEGDSVAAVRLRWEARVDNNPQDHAAMLGLATLDRLTYDYGPADRALAGLAADPATPSAVRAYALLGHGQAFADRGQREAALERLTAAAEQFSRLRMAAAEADALLGLVDLHRGATEDSLLALARERAPAGDLALQARLRCGRAGPPGPDGARLELDGVSEGAELARRSGNRRTYGACLRSVAQAHYRLGDYAAALAAIRRAADVQHSAANRTGVAAALDFEGMIHLATGEYGRASAVLLYALAEARAAGASHLVAKVLLPIATNALRFGDVPAARRHAAEADSLLTALGNRRLLATLRGIEADIARAAGDTAGAFAAYRAALEAGGSHDGYPSIAPRRGLASLLRQRGEWDAAEAELLAARRAAQAHRLEEWGDRLGYDLATLALARGDLDDAERRFTTFLAAIDRNAPKRGYAARTRLAEIHALRGNLGHAEAAYSAAADELDAWRATLDDRELRLLVFQRREDDADPDLGVATIVARLAMGGRTASAFALAERRRARELTDRLARRQVLGGRADAAGEATAPSRYAGATPAADVRAALPDGATAVLAFTTGRGGEPTTLFVLTRDELLAVPLPPIDSLEADIRRFAAAVEGGSDARPLGQQLGASVLEPALRALPPNVGLLIIVPDDVLHRLPWDALLLADGRFVVERYAIGVSPSATIAARLWQRPDRAREPRILAMGDPVFAGERAAPRPVRDVYRSAFDVEGALPRLRASGAEARRVARYAADADVRLRHSASAEFLTRADLAVYSVIHFATHARVDEVTLGGMALALTPGADDDGFVGPPQLASLRLDADLVVLSACRTAGGTIVGGEGVQGLTAPLLEAGARAVVATAWPIGDRATVRFVDDFYGALADGLRAGDALRAAKLAALRRGAPAAEWAAFTLIGDSHVRVPLRRPGWPPAVWLGALVVPLLGIGLGGLSWRRRVRRRVRRRAEGGVT